MPSNHLILIPFSSCLQYFPVSGAFPMSQFFASGGQSIEASASMSVLPMNIKDWFHLGWTGLISLQSKGLSRVSFNTTVQKYQFSSAQFSLYSNSHTHTWLLEKTIVLTRQTFVGKVISLLFNMLSRLIITFLPKSKGKYFIFSGSVLPGYRKPEQKVWSLNTVSSGWCCDSLIEMKSCPPYPIG